MLQSVHPSLPHFHLPPVNPTQSSIPPNSHLHPQTMGLKKLHPTSCPPPRTRLPSRPQNVHTIIDGHSATPPHLRETLHLPPHEQPSRRHHLQRSPHASLRHHLQLITEQVLLHHHNQHRVGNPHHQCRNGSIPQPMLPRPRRTRPVFRKRQTNPRLPRQPPAPLASAHASVWSQETTDHQPPFFANPARNRPHVVVEEEIQSRTCRSSNHTPPSSRNAHRKTNTPAAELRRNAAVRRLSAWRPGLDPYLRSAVSVGADRGRGRFCCR